MMSYQNTTTPYEFDCKILNKIKCIYCHQNNLDLIYECEESPSKKHEIDQKLLDEVANDCAENFLLLALISDDEKDSLGVQQSTKLVFDNNNTDEFFSSFYQLIRSNSDVKEMLDAIFPISTFRYLEKMDEDEKKFIQGINTISYNYPKKSENMTVEQYDKLKGKIRTTQRLQYLKRDHTKFTELFSDVLTSKLFKTTIEDFIKDPLFINFLNNSFQNLMQPLIDNPIFQNYYKEYTLSTLSMDQLKNIYVNIIMKKTDCSKNDIFSIDVIRDLVRNESIFYLIQTEEQIRNFILKFTEFKNSGHYEYGDFLMHIKHLFKVRLLDQAQCLTYLKGPERSYKTQYMLNTIAGNTNPYNFTYSINLEKIILKYRFKIQTPTKTSVRKLLTFGNKDKNTKEIYDFLDLYIKIKPDNDISYVAYKNGNDNRLKPRNKYFLEKEGGEDYFGVYFTYDGENELEIPYAKVIFDLSNGNCFVIGTSTSIQKMLLKLTNEFQLHFIEKKFISFKGSMMVNSTGVFSKRILQDVFKTQIFSKYWLTKSQTTCASNHSFIYYSETLKNVPSIFDESVTFHINLDSKDTIIYNNWKVEFEGNANYLIIPFISMFSALVHFLNNVPYDKRLEMFRKAQYEMLDFHKRKSKEKQKTQDTALTLIAQHEIAKREVYNKAIKEAISDPIIAEHFTGRSKPLIINPISPYDIETVNRWKTFFARILLNNHPVFLENPKTQYCNITLGDLEEMREKVIITREALIVNGNPIGIRFMEKFFLNYPEKGKLSRIELKDGIPTKSSSIILDNSKISSLKNQKLSSRRKGLTPGIQEIVSQFTDIMPSKSGFYYPAKQDFHNFKTFVNTNFPTKEMRRTLLAQHTWDLSDDEIDDTFKEININYHQDLLQHYHKCLIVYFEFDSSKKSYKFKLPRHKNWYAINQSYDNAMFIFKIPQGLLDTVYFDYENNYIPIDQKFKTFLRKITTEQEYITTEQIISMLDSDEKILGQFFDTNAKSCGIRVQNFDNGKIMDLRYNSQFCLYEHDISSSNCFDILVDVQVNVTEKFGNFALDDRFTLVNQTRSNNKYRISDIYEKNRLWKQSVYIFWRAVISYWLILQKNKPHNKIFTNQEVGNFIGKKILRANTARPLKEHQIIESLVVIEQYEHLLDFEKYLESIYPNRFYDSAFHVNDSDHIHLSNYMYQEICLIKNYPPIFTEHFLNVRMNTSFIKLYKDEIISPENIFHNNLTIQIKKNMEDEKFFLFSSYFSAEMDPEYKDKNSKEKRAELVIIPFRGHLCYIRMTKSGNSQVAMKLCEMWHKHHQVGSYYETEKRQTLSRKFILHKKNIYEAEDNEEENLKISGQDYWILIYPLKDGRHVYAAMLPFEKV